MGAYNLLIAPVKCYSCDHETEEILQVHIGWCRYDKYHLGDNIIWMTPEEREETRQITKELSELRTRVEAGSFSLEEFATSAGGHECGWCKVRGSVLAVIKENVFQSVLFVAKEIPYPSILTRRQLDEVIKSRKSSDLNANQD